MLILRMLSGTQATAVCPGRDTLLAFTQGRLPESDLGAVGEHLAAECPRCEAELQALQADADPLLDPLRAPAAISFNDAEGAARRVLERVPAVNPHDATTAPHAPPAKRPPRPLPHFTPAGQPGEALPADALGLFRRRLLFASAVIACLYAVYLVKIAVFYEGYRFEDFTYYESYQFHNYTFGNWVSFLIVHATTFVAVCLTGWLLWSKRPFSIRRLRVIELVIVGLPLLNQCWLEYQRLFVDHRLLFYLHTGTESVATGRTHVLPWVILIVGYGILIPNRLRRTAAVVTAMAVAALALNVIAAAVNGVLFRTEILHHLLEVALWLGVALAFALYNAYRLEQLVPPIDKYRLLSWLGEGGMGVVYLAFDETLERYCVLKLIRPERAGDPKMQALFKSEVRLTAQLTHPNKPEIYAYGCSGGTFYCAMEYLPGVNLQRLVSQCGPLPPGRVVHLLRQVCGALAEAHARGLIHRDVKPSNVMASVRGGVYDFAKLLDFGLVRAVAAAGGGLRTRERGFAGTPEYMSPEQAREEELDGRSDLYSLGATAYYLLTGRVPFIRANHLDTMIAHVYEAPEPPRAHRPDVPEDLQAVVMRCLEKDPGRRYQSAAELEAALAGCACADEWGSETAAVWWRERVAAFEEAKR